VTALNNLTPALDGATRRAILDLSKGLTSVEELVAALTAELEAFPLSGTYTPALTGMAVGTGGGATNTADYTYNGVDLFVHGQIKFGTSGTTLPGASITVGLPTGYAMPTPTVSVVHVLSEVTFIDFGTNVFDGVCRHEVGTNNALRLLPQTTGSTYGGYAVTSATVPHAWANGDEIDYWFNVKATFTTSVYHLLLEGGDDILLEDGTFLLLE
jgi:hypothetical protein